MKIVLDRYAADAPIPVQQFIKNRKLAKYFNRETAAALVAVGKLLDGAVLDPLTPFYYETGVMGCESLGLDAIANGSRNADGDFEQQGFVERGAKAVPPLTQFKALYNMPLSFVAIEHELRGDNAVIYGSASGLLLQAQCASAAGEVLLGCGKIQVDGSVESSFALLGRDELRELCRQPVDGEAIELFRRWAAAREAS